MGMRLVNPIESSGSHRTFYTHSTAKYGFRPPGNVTCTPYTMCMFNTKSATTPNAVYMVTWPVPPPPPPPTHTHTHDNVLTHREDESRSATPGGGLPGCFYRLPLPSDALRLGRRKIRCQTQEKGTQEGRGECPAMTLVYGCFVQLFTAIIQQEMGFFDKSR